MAYAPWLGSLGWSIFFIGLVTAIALFSIKRKFYPVMYLVSIATYIFTVGFVIEAFDFNKNLTLITLAISSVVFIGSGVYISAKFEKHKEDFAKSIPSKQ
jgi:predicted transporter